MSKAPPLLSGAATMQLLAELCVRLSRRLDRRGFGRLPTVIITPVTRPTVMPRRAEPPWRHLPRAGGGSDVHKESPSAWKSSRFSRTARRSLLLMRPASVVLGAWRLWPPEFRLGLLFAPSQAIRWEPAASTVADSI